MTLTCRVGRSRRRACWGWLVFCFWVCAFWFGMLGIGLVCVGATRWLRELARQRSFIVILNDTELMQVWALPQVLRIQLERRHYWVWRDELAENAWRGLRRYLRTRLPGQALGFSMSR